MRTESTRPDRPMSVIGNRSLAKPGSMPVVKQLLPVSSQTATTESISPGPHTGGYTQGVIAVDTQCLPARIDAIALLKLAPGWAAVGPKWATATASRDSTSSMSVLHARPIGSRPMRVPTSTPSFSGLFTITPTSSNSGCPIRSRSTIFPTYPVPQTMILSRSDLVNATTFPLQTAPRVGDRG